MRTLLAATFIGLVVFVLAVACLDQPEACAQEGGEIVSGIPWSDGERAEYVLLDRGNLEECGTGTLTVAHDGDEYQLTLRFVDGDNSDTSVVTVDDTSLEPFFVRRERIIEGELEAVEGEYDREAEVIRVVEFDDENPRAVPRTLDEDVYYDNEASLFLWRTIRFEEGYEVKYTTVLVNQGGSTRDITLRVIGKEEVEVPAGTFDAWRVDISGTDLEQVAFFADTPEHQLVFYDNSFQIFQLVSFQP